MKITLQPWVHWGDATTFRDGISISWTVNTVWLILLAHFSHWLEKSRRSHDGWNSERQKHLTMRIRQWPKQSFQTVKNFGTSGQKSPTRARNETNHPILFRFSSETITEVLIFFIQHGIRSSGDRLLMWRSEDLYFSRACLKLRFRSIYRKKKKE